MKNIPVTHHLSICGLDDRFRRFMLRELAANGGENAVLSTDMLDLIYHADDPNAMLAKIKKDVVDAGLKFVDAHSPFGPHLDMNCPIYDDRKKLLDLHKFSLACCSECEIDSITIHSGNSRFPGVRLEEYRSFVRQTLEELLPVAERYGVTICIENIWFPTNSAAELLYYYEYFKSPYLGLCYDSGHANLVAHESDDPEHPVNVAFGLMKMPPEYEHETLEKMLPYIVTCHLHDNDGFSDKHWIPFRGNIDWDKTMKLLAKAPNLRCLQNESSTPGNDMYSSLGDTCRVFNRLVDIFNSNK